MKKLKSTWYNMAIVLTLIAVIAGGLLAYVNSITEGPIAEINQKNEDQAKKDVLCTDEIEILNETTINLDGKEFIVYNAGEKGCAVKAVDPNNASFGGDLTIMVGFDPDGNVLGYSILNTNETPGLGAKAADWFQKDGKGSIIGMNPGEKELTVKKDGGDVDAITASTITSRSFLRAVNAAYDAYRQSLGRGPMPAPDTQTGATQQASANEVVEVVEEVVDSVELN